MPENAQPINYFIQGCYLSNEAEYCLCVIFLENYSNLIFENKMLETTVKETVRKFTLWFNEVTI